MKYSFRTYYWLILQAYMKKRDGEALSKYNECLRLAPPESPTLPIAYANRSAVLVQMAKYEVCIRGYIIGVPVGCKFFVAPYWLLLVRSVTFLKNTIFFSCSHIFMVYQLQDALLDLHRAEKAGYPTSLQHKILARRVKCHTALGHLEQAREMLENLKNITLPPNIKGIYIRRQTGMV